MHKKENILFYIVFKFNNIITKTICRTYNTGKL